MKTLKSPTIPKMYKFGFLVHDLSANEINYTLLQNINQRIHQNLDEDFITFYENAIPPCVPNIGCTMQMAEAYLFDGLSIATTLPLAYRLLSFPSCARAYYMFDLEWMRFPTKNYHQLAEIYKNPLMNLIVPSEEYGEVVERVWQRKPYIIGDWDFDKLRDLYDKVVKEKKVEISYGSR